MSPPTEPSVANPRFDGILERIAVLADKLNLGTLRSQIAACHEMLSHCNGVDVAVFGRFKAGKSSFLNHLTGRDVLPIGVVPLTAVITRLRFGASERAEVQFLNGTTEEIPLDDIRLYVGEDQNPNNEKKVASVEVELPTLKPFNPLRFVDTPGLGSAFAHNTEVALNWVPNVGAALVAVSSDAPLSERDLALLDELRRHTPKIVLLLTKADLLTEPQRSEVLTFVQTQLRQKWNGGLPVFFYSILPDESDLKARLEKDLFGPLLRNRAEATGQIANHKLASLTDQLLDYLRIALATSMQAESARHALGEKLAEERLQFDLLRSELNTLSREWSASALDFYLAKLQPTQSALQSKITTELREHFPRWNMRLPRMLEVWREWLGAFLNRELSEVSLSKRTMFCEPLQKARQQLTRTLGAFRGRLAEHVKSALGVTMTAHEFILEIREPSVPPVNVAYAFDAAFTTIGGLIPLALFQKPIEGVLLRKARYEIEKNLSRLAVDWRDRVGKSIGELAREGEKQALDELVALEQTLARAPSKTAELKQAIDELERFRGRASSAVSSGSTSVPCARCK